MVGAASILMLAAACSSGSDDATPTTATTVVVLQVPVVETDFCDQMYNIRLRALQGDGPTDTDELIAEYEVALGLAPEAIRPDLEALIATLRSGSAPATSAGDVEADNDDGEGWQPSANPSDRVFDYVETYCTGTSANPGPAATVPA